MGRLPQEFLDELLMRTDIVDVVDARVPLKKAGKNYAARCPFHDEKTPSFTVSPEKQFYHCFGCGAHGNAIDFLMEYEHMGFREAVAELAARAGLEVPAGGGGPRGAATARLEGLLEAADRFFRQQLRSHPAAREAVDYLKGRGVSGEIAARFGLGFAPPGWDNLLKALGTEPSRLAALEQAGLVVRREGDGHYDRFRRRIMFPIHDYRGRLVGFGGRALGEEQPKYLNSPETALFHKGRELYGLHRAREAIRSAGRVLVVEGYLDVLALAQAGIGHTVATLGTATTRQHLERLYRYTSEVVFCFDGDAAGRQAAWRALEAALPVMEDGRRASFLFLPEGEDPDSLVRREGPERFSGRLAGAQPLPDFLFETLAARVDLGRLEGRAELARRGEALLNRLPRGALRSLMFKRLGEITGVEDLGRGGRRPRVPPVTGRAQAAPSLVRRAISVLLQAPRLAREVEDPEALAGLAQPGAELLVALLNAAREHPGLSTAALLERFRDSPDRAHLEKLAAKGHIFDGEALSREFQDTFLKLKAQRLEQDLDRLLARPHLGPEDKAELEALLREQARLKGRAGDG